MTVANPCQVIEPDSLRVSAKFFYVFRDMVKHHYDIIIDIIERLYSSRNCRITRASSSGLW